MKGLRLHKIKKKQKKIQIQKPKKAPINQEALSVETVTKAAHTLSSIYFY